MHFKDLTGSQIEIIGQRLNCLRAKAKVSAATVARDALGYENGSHVAVTRLERGLLAEPREDHLLALAKYYRVRPETLLQPVPQEEPAEEVTTSPALAEAKKPPEKAEPKPKTFAERVRWARRAANLEPENFALNIRENGALVTSLDVIAWEKQEKEPNPIQLRALARSTNQSEDWFVTGSETKAASLKDSSRTRSQASHSVWL